MSSSLRQDIVKNVKQYFNSVMNVMNFSLQNCATFAGNDMSIKIVDVKGNVDINHLDWSQWASINTQCVQQQSFTDIGQKLLVIAQNSAKTIVGTMNKYDVDVSGSDVEDVMVNISNTVTNTLQQTCVLNIQNQQQIIIAEVDKDVTIEYLKWTQVIDGVLSCIQQSGDVKNTLDQLWRTLGIDNPDNGNSTLVINLLKNFAAYVAILFVLVLVLLSTQHSNPVVYTVLMLVLLLYVSICKVWNGFPYNVLPDKVGMYTQYIVISLVIVIPIIWILLRRI
jgi:hypothetical protein